MYTNDILIDDHRRLQKEINSSDGIIKYIDEGKGEAILLLHGIPTSSWLYRKMICNLVEKGYRVIVPDMLGFGNSYSPDGYDVYSSENHAKRIIELMDSLQIKNWIHLLHDAGGLWTWELFRSQPKRISRLIILNTLLLEEGFFPPMKMKEGILAKFILSLYRKKITAATLLKILFKNGLSKNKLSRNEMEGYRKSLLEGKTNGMYYFFTQLSQPFPNYIDVFEQINIPVMVIWGEEDKILRWTPQKEEVIKLLKIKRDNVHVIKANHFLQEEEPKKLTTLINDFINQK